MKRISKEEHKAGTDCAKPQTQEDQVYEELNTDQHSWRVGGEPGRWEGAGPHNNSGCNGEPRVCFRESEWIRLAFKKKNPSDSRRGGGGEIVRDKVEAAGAQ